VSILFPIPPEELFHVQEEVRPVATVKNPTSYLCCADFGQHLLRKQAVKVRDKHHRALCFQGP